MKKRYAGLKWIQKWSDAKGALELRPANEADPFAPSQSGLETQRRDTTLMVAEGMTPVLSILLDYRTPAELNARRARAYIWRTMAAPLLDGTVNLRKLVLSRQLRKPAAAYRQDGRAPPVHAVLADKLLVRAGGDASAPGVPRPGDRVAFVIVSGARRQPSAERGEPPQYVLEHGLRVDAQYYLAQHVAPPFERLFDPIVNADAARAQVHGKDAAALRRERNKRTRAYLFGAVGDTYGAPADVAEHAAALEPFIQRDEARRRFDAAPVRYRLRSQQHATTLAAALGNGARCTECGTFFTGRYEGFVCAACVARAPADVQRRVERRARAAARDVRQLETERARVYHHCQTCAGHAAAPLPITCQNDACWVYWERLYNWRTLAQARERWQTTTEVLRVARTLAGDW